ncbi:reverse transcriptase domain-containing protein [Tanacetum coccineum]
MAKLLRTPTEGYAEEIVVPLILAGHFELKHSLINMMTSDQFFGLEKDNPHDHIRWFNKITSTIKYKDVPNSAIKLMLFPFSLAGAARRWLEKEPPRSILTWEDLVSKFINEFFPPSRTTNLRNEISNFQQKFDESFHEAWDRYKDLLRACPHHGFTELHQLDTFYNALNPADQDSLNSAAGGNLLERSTQDVLTIIENKSKVRNSRNKSIVSQVKSSDGNSSSSDIAKLTHAVNQQTSAVTTAMTAILKQFQATPPPASVKAVEEICVTCGGPHPYYQCLAADGNTFPEYRDNIQGYVAAAAAITTQSGLVLDGPTVPMPPPFINPEEDERVEENLTDPKHGEFTIKVPPLHVQKAKPPSQRNFVIHQRDPRHPYIPYPSRMNQEKRQEKDEVQIHKFWKMFKQLHTNIYLVDALILIPKYQKMLKSLLSNKEKLIELANTPLNENCSTVILKKLPEKLGDPGKFLIPCGFSELKCKALAMTNLFGTNHLSGNLTSFSHPDLTSPEVNDDIFNLEEDIIENFLNLDKTKDLPPYHDNPLSGNPTLISKPVTKSSSSSPTLTSIEESDLIWEEFEAYLASDSFPLGNSNHSSHLPPFHNSLSGSTTSSSPSLPISETSDYFLKEFADELAYITFPPGNDNLPFDAESDLREIKYLLNHDPINEVDSTLEDSVDKNSPNDNLVDTISKMFTDEHAFDYSSPPLWDDYDDELFDLKTVNDDTYDDSFYSKEEKFKDSKILIDELDPPRSSDFLLFPKCDSAFYEDFYEVDALSSINNEDKVFNPGILIHENLYEITNCATPDKNVKKLTNTSLILEDFNPPLYELPFHKEVPGLGALLSFSSENKEKVFNLRIITSKRVHTSFLLELSHRGPKAFKVIKILESPMEIFPCSYGEDIRVLDVPCLHFYPP